MINMTKLRKGSKITLSKEVKILPMVEAEIKMVKMSLGNGIRDRKDIFKHKHFDKKNFKFKLYITLTIN